MARIDAEGLRRALETAERILAYAQQGEWASVGDWPGVQDKSIRALFSDVTECADEERDALRRLKELTDRIIVLAEQEKARVAEELSRLRKNSTVNKAYLRYNE